MSKWFECKVKYDKSFKEGEDPQQSKPENYLVDALSFTEAESRIIEEITPYSIGGIEVQAVKKSNITEIVENVDPQADKWYRAKVMFISLDNDKEKRTPCQYLIQAADFGDAFKQLTDVGLKNIQAEYDIASIAETTIMDIFKYEPKEEKKE
ncbi:MAG: DUF4494 domain-containing protein [bacterium]|nr:DUF4494 domain-containing protein [Candidatus Minthenecus merdequi]